MKKIDIRRFHIQDNIVSSAFSTENMMGDLTANVQTASVEQASG